MNHNDKYSWSFRVVAPTYSEIAVVVLSQEQYDIDGSDYTALLNTYAYEDKGGWRPPYRDTWYILYINIGDSDVYLVIEDKVEDGFYLLITIIPIVVVITIVAIIAIIAGVLVARKKKKPQIKFYQCLDCGASIRLEEKFYGICGADNLIRKEELVKLEMLGEFLEEAKVKRLEKLQSSGDRKSPRDRRVDELEGEFLNYQVRRVKMMKARLETGITFDEKLEWVKRQYHEMNKSIQEIAEELGESMITVKNYLNKIEESQKSAEIKNGERFMKLEKRRKAEQIICNFLMENKGKAFTKYSLNNRCLELQQLDLEIDEIESISKYLSSLGKIGLEVKESGVFYYIH